MKLYVFHTLTTVILIISQIHIGETGNRNACFPEGFQSLDISEFELLGKWFETERTYFPLENWYSCVQFEFSLGLGDTLNGMFSAFNS